jgi:hypothetical protein
MDGRSLPAGCSLAASNASQSQTPRRVRLVTRIAPTHQSRRRAPALLHAGADALVVLCAVLGKELRGLRVGRGRRVRVAQQRLNGGEYGSDVVNRAPLVLQDVEADLPVGVDCGAFETGRRGDKGNGEC